MEILKKRLLTEKISKFLDIPVVHSPVRGLHPNLVEGLLTFVKFIGSENIEYLKNLPQPEQRSKAWFCFHLI